MFKPLAALIALVSSLGCGTVSSTPEEEPQRDCESENATCEWAASRSSSRFTYYFAARECSWNYGICIGKLGEAQCAEWCEHLTLVPSECVYGCEAFNTTSTVSG